jgi:hypothetical protein
MNRHWSRRDLKPSLSPKKQGPVGSRRLRQLGVGPASGRVVGRFKDGYRVWQVVHCALAMQLT